MLTLITQNELRSIKEKVQAQNLKRTKVEVNEEVHPNWLPGDVIDLT
jgi:hypothetical protein